MTAEYLLFLLAGRLLIFFGSKFARDNKIKITFLNKLLSCSLCSGFWAYSILSFLFGIYVFEDALPIVPIVSSVVTGAISSYFVYLAETGYRSLYEVIVV